MTTRRPAGVPDLEWFNMKRREADGRSLLGLATTLADVAARLRIDAADPIPRDEAYRVLYRARTSLSQVVARYGAGVPPRN